MERLGIELAIEDNFTQAFSSVASTMFSTFDTIGGKSDDTVKMWQSVITSVTSSIPMVGGVVSTLIDSLFSASDAKSARAMEKARANATQMATQNALAEAQAKYALASEDRASDEALHQLRISNLMREIEARKKAGQDITQHQISLLEQEASHREALLKKAFSLQKEALNFEMEQYRFLSSMGSEQYSSSESKLSFLAGEIQKLQNTYNVGDITNLSSAQYMNYSDEQKYAVDKIRNLLLEIERISKSDVKADIDFSSSQEIKEVSTPTINTYNVSVKNDFSGAFITESPREFYSNRLEPLVIQTLENEALRY